MLRYDTNNASGTVLHMTVIVEGNYQDFRIGFASYIEQIVFEQYAGGMHQKLARFVKESEDDTILAASRGFIFEFFAHRIIAKGGAFKVCLSLWGLINLVGTGLIYGMLTHFDRFVDWEPRAPRTQRRQ